MVAAAGTLDAPQVLARRRIVIADPGLRGSKQPYHAAAELPLPEAEVLVRNAMESSHKLAVEAIMEIVKALEVRGYEVAGCAVLRGSGKPLPHLAAILASHALIHTAEGEMFREALVSASQVCGLSVAGVREKEIAARPLGQIDSLGKKIGPPWTQDQKYAAVAALTALQMAPLP
jgi:hypothetical protein